MWTTAKRHTVFSLGMVQSRKLMRFVSETGPEIMTLIFQTEADEHFAVFCLWQDKDQSHYDWKKRRFAMASSASVSKVRSSGQKRALCSLHIWIRDQYRTYSAKGMTRQKYTQLKERVLLRDPVTHSHRNIFCVSACRWRKGICVNTVNRLSVQKKKNADAHN